MAITRTRLLAFVITGVVVVAGLMLGVPREPTVAAQKHQHGRVIIDAPGVVNGAIDPDSIPDHAAYSILFRILAEHRSPAEYARAAAYVKYRLRIDGAECLSFDRFPEAVPPTRSPALASMANGAIPVSCPPGTRPVAHRDRIFSVARRYAEPVIRAESAAKAQATTAFGASAGAAFVAQARQEGLATVLADLDASLGADTAARLRTFVRSEMKAKMKLVPGRMGSDRAATR